MADLLTAAQTQLKYAENEIKSGDIAKGLTHMEKARTFLVRHGEDTGQRPALVAAQEEASDWSGTWDEAYARWLDAADEALIAAGRPAGRNGEERGALDREESIAIAKRIGVFDELGGDNGIWGPPPGPGVIA